MPRLPGVQVAVDVANALAAGRNGDALAVLGGGAAQLAGAAGTVAGLAGSLAVTAIDEAANAVTDSVRSATDLLDQLRETVQALHRFALRADAVTAELEEPLLALAPGLRRLAVALDDAVIEELPVTLRQVQDDVLPVLRTLADTHERVAFIAGQTERIMSFVDDTSRSLAGLPGAALLGRRRAAGGRVIPGETGGPLSR